MSTTTQRHHGKPRGQGKHGRPTWNQAQKIIRRFGGEAQLARALGMNRITLYRWNYSRPSGSDGMIPAMAAAAIHQLAQRMGVTLSPEDWAAERIVYREDPPTAPEQPGEHVAC